jgi:hypothetical protein
MRRLNLDSGLRHERHQSKARCVVLRDRTRGRSPRLRRVNAMRVHPLVRVGSSFSMKGITMKRFVSAVLTSLFAVAVYAQSPAQPAAPAKPAVPATKSDTKAPATPAAPAAPATKAEPAGASTAANGCEAKAVGKDGKPLAGAAKKSFLKKCEQESKGAASAAKDCEAKAVGKNGKPLAGAAKASFIKKCEAGK